MNSVGILKEITKIKKELCTQEKSFYVQSGALKTQSKINEKILEKLSKIEEEIKSLASRVALLENTKHDYKPDYSKYYKDWFKTEPFLSSDNLNSTTIFWIEGDVSDEFKKKCSKSHRGKKLSEEHKENVRQSLLNYWEKKKNE